MCRRGTRGSQAEGHGERIHRDGLLPLVPGFALFSGMLAISQGNTQDAWAALGEAGTISIAIAVGVAIGLSLGRDSLAIVRRLTPASDK